MQDTNAANTVPDSDNMGLSNGSAARTKCVSANLMPRQCAELDALQHILLVEDDAALAALEAGILTAHGYTVVTVNSGERAIDMLRSFEPDLVVLDLELVGNVNGWDVLRTLRVTTTIPVLLTTSSVTAVRKYIRSLGETRLTLDHLPKPYPMQTLLKRVQRMLMIAP